MNFLPDQWFTDMLAEREFLYKPDGYTLRRVRDRRWLWLRHKTVRVPYWRPIRIKLSDQ